MSVTLDWGSLSGADGYDYEVLVGNTLVAGYGITYFDGPWRHTAVTLSLDYGKSYRWRVRGRVLPQNNPWSGYWTFSTVPVPVPRQISPANGSAVVGARVTLDWSSVGAADGYDFEVLEGDTVVAGYGINYSGGPYRGTSVSLDLGFGKIYRWRVRGRVLPQNNPWSDYWTFSTGSIPVPTNLAVSVLSSTSVRISWNNPAATIEAIQIYQSRNNSAFELGENVSPDRESAVRDGLDPNVGYGFKVRVQIAGRWSDFSEPRYVTLPPNPIVPPPTDIATSLLSPTSVQITWKNPPAAIQDIELYQSDDGVTYALVAKLPVTAQSTVRSDLNSGTEYWFKVRVQVGGQWSDFTIASHITTPEEPPVEPARIVYHAKMLRYRNAPLFVTTINSSGEMAGFTPQATGRKAFYTINKRVHIANLPIGIVYGASCNDNNQFVFHGDLGSYSLSGGRFRSLSVDGWYRVFGQFINDGGVIVGSGYQTSNSSLAAIKYQNLHLKEIPLPAIIGNCINNHGDIVGMCRSGIGVTSVNSACKITGGATSLIPLPTNNYSRAVRINNRRQICGEFQLANGQRHIFRIKGAQLEDEWLGTAPDVVGVNDMDSRGKVVGFVAKQNGREYGYLWTSRGLIDLNAVTSGLNGLTIYNAMAISDNGTISVALQDSNYVEFAAILEP